MSRPLHSGDMLERRAYVVAALTPNRGLRAYHATWLVSDRHYVAREVDNEAQADLYFSQTEAERDAWHREQLALDHGDAYAFAEGDDDDIPF